MIERLKIENLGVIRSAEIEFAKGFTVVTGETGAGKTMVLTALGLICGGKADPALVSKGAKNSAIEGFFDVASGFRTSDSKELVATLEDCGAVIDDGLLIMARDVPKDGRPKCVVGGKSVPASVASDVSEFLLTVHGQGDQTRLAKPSQQRLLLDRFAGESHLARLRELGKAYETWTQLCAELERLKNLTSASTKELADLEIDVADVRALNPTPGEFQMLEEDLINLVNSGAILETLAQVVRALDGDEEAASGAASGLANAAQGLSQLSQFGKRFEEAKAEIEASLTNVAQVLADLKAFYADFDLDPARLAAAQDRKATYLRLAKRISVEPAHINDWLIKAEQRLLDLDPDPARSSNLEKEVGQQADLVMALAIDVSKTRIQAAKKLSDEVTQEVRELAMPKATFSVEVTQVEMSVTAVGAHGFDDVEFLFSAHDATDLRPLAKAASGGERSRVMLAIEVVLANADPVPTFVFDEVDAGVGGKAAVEVGRRLARLGQHAQVIVVTHLPQVAAFAEGHIRVQKGVTDEITTTDVCLLDETERVVELSRMLAGVEESSAARQHAQELIAMGKAERVQLVHS